MRWALFLLLALPVRADNNLHEIKINNGVKFDALLSLLARDTNTLVLYDASDPKFGQCFKRSFETAVPADKLLGVYRAIFAFFEVQSTHVEGIIFVGSRFGGPKPYRITVAGFGTETTVVPLVLCPLGLIVGRHEALVPASHQALLKMLDDRNEGRRAQGARLCRLLGPLDGSLVQALRRALKDKSGLVRHEAKQALDKLNRDGRKKK